MSAIFSGRRDSNLQIVLLGSLLKSAIMDLIPINLLAPAPGVTLHVELQTDDEMEPIRREVQNVAWQHDNLVHVRVRESRETLQVRV